MQVECTRCGTPCEPGTPAGEVHVEVLDYSNDEFRVVDLSEMVCRSCLEAFTFSFADDEGDTDADATTATPTGSYLPGEVLDGDDTDVDPTGLPRE